MKKIIFSAVCCAAVGAMLVGCTIPGINGSGDDNSMTDSYSYTADPVTDDSENYSWIIEPTIAADNIIVFDGSQVDTDNILNTAYANYAVISQDGRYGLIDYKGNIVIEPDYDDYYTCWCGEIVLFNIIDERNGLYEYCTIDGSKQISDTPSNHTDSSPEYFWDAENSQIYVLREGDEYASAYTGKKAVVVCEAEITDDGSGKYLIDAGEEPLYGLAKKDTLLIEPQYTDYYAPAYKGSGATYIAFKNSEGMWGYVDSDGEIVIDFKCDGDMSSYNGMLIDDADKSHPYLFNGDYLPVSIGAAYGYYDKEGNAVIHTGEFQQARPVHNGRAWVRQNGLWGVIQLGEIVEEEPTVYEDSSSETSTTKKTTSAATATTTTSETSSAVSSASESSKSETSLYTEQSTAQSQASDVSEYSETEATTASAAAETTTQTQAPATTAAPQTDPVTQSEQQ